MPASPTSPRLSKTRRLLNQRHRRRGCRRHLHCADRPWPRAGQPAAHRFVLRRLPVGSPWAQPPGAGGGSRLGSGRRHPADRHRAAVDTGRRGVRYASHKAGTDSFTRHQLLTVVTGHCTSLGWRSTPFSDEESAMPRRRPASDKPTPCRLCQDADGGILDAL